MEKDICSRHDPNDVLLSLARRSAEVYAVCTQPRSILLTGSAATGQSDYYSDIDLVAHYTMLPFDDQMACARRSIDGASTEPPEARSEGAVIEAYSINGVDCQVGHILIDRVEHDIDDVLTGLSVDPMAHKKLTGLQEGVPLHGEDLIRRWQARIADYPESLVRAMVEHYLGQLFPVWYHQDYLMRRDATLWRQQLLVESAQNILGILAGLNRRYYSTFQFKRMRHFIAELQIAPIGLADRIEQVFSPDFALACRELEGLAGETVVLVDVRMPEVDTSSLRAKMGERVQPWSV